MKRWVPRILLILGAGLLLDLAIAWACAAWSPALWRGVSPAPSMPPDRIDERGRWHGTYTITSLARGPGVRAWSEATPGRTIEPGANGSNRRHEGRERARFEAGWPLRSHAWTIRSTFTVDAAAARVEPIPARWGAWERGVRADWLPLGDPFSLSARRLPLAPVWPGLAVNTLLYAGTVGLACWAPGAFRRERRRRCALCPNCAYPMGVSDVCTECGRPVRRAAPEAGE